MSNDEKERHLAIAMQNETSELFFIGILLIIISIVTTIALSYFYEGT